MDKKRQIKANKTQIIKDYKDCKEKILYHIQNLVNIISEIEPTYNYLLIDLSI